MFKVRKLVSCNKIITGCQAYVVRQLNLTILPRTQTIVTATSFYSNARSNKALVCHHNGSLGNYIYVQKNLFSSNMPNAAEEFRHLDYEQLMEIKNKEQHILIDVREKSELQETGSIPGAQHIPVGEIEKALSISEEDFKNTYKFNKPSVNDQVIFSCRSGKRSLMALEKALAKGYSNAKHYKGGWLDWEQNAGSKQ